MKLKNNLLQDSIRMFHTVLILVLLFCVVLGSNGLIYAQSSVCIKEVDDSLSVDGVVASGAAMDGCTVDTVWLEVIPVEFLPSDSSPEAYLYLAYRPINNRLFIGIDIFGDEDLSELDHVYLLFDANNDDTWNAGDFYIKVVVSPSMSPITSGTLCDQATGIVLYYQYGAYGWEEVTVSGVASAVNSKAAYDYDSTLSDPEEKIWNLEIDMPIGLVVDSTTYFDLQTTSPYFGIGAYIFVDDGHLVLQEGTVMKWPSSMVDRTITQQNMGGIPSSQASELGDASLEDVCFDVNFEVSSPWEINGFTAEAFDEHIIRDAVNQFRVRFYFDGHGEDATPLTNTGTVRIRLRPFGNVSTGSSYDWIKEQEVDAEQYNHAKTVDFEYDFAAPPANWSSFDTIDFVCAWCDLINFEHDEMTGNNQLYINHNRFTTSEYQHKFFIYGDSIPILKSDKSGTIFLRFQSNNEIERIKNQEISIREGYYDWLKCLVLVLIVAIIIVIVIVLRRMTRKASFSKKNTVLKVSLSKKPIIFIILIIIIIILFFVFKDWLKTKSPGLGNDRWVIRNFEPLGIEPVEGKRGWFKMPIKYGEIKPVDLKFSGLELPYKTMHHLFSPAAPDSSRPNILRIPVEPNQVVSVFAFGQIDLDGPKGPLPPTSPTGFVASSIVKQSERSFLLSSGYYSPHEYAGALIGSFDNFETSFVVSRNSSIVVPGEASTLSLAVNAVSGTYNKITGSFDIFTISTPLPRVPTHTRMKGDETYNIPSTVTSWLVLTSLNVYTYYQTEDLGEDGTVRGRTMHPCGFVHYTIFDTHVGGESRRAVDLTLNIKEEFDIR